MVKAGRDFWRPFCPAQAGPIRYQDCVKISFLICPKDGDSTTCL